MINPDGSPFGEFLKDLGIPGQHSFFAAAYGKNAWGEHNDFRSNDYKIIGFRLMPLKEAASYAMRGKDLLWFYEELKRRYENIYWFYRNSAFDYR